MITIAINGFGRIGRMVTRALYESGRENEFKLVAINDLMTLEHRQHLFKFDSVHGPFPGTVELSEDALTINGQVVKLLSEPKPENLPWALLVNDQWQWPTENTDLIEAYPEYATYAESSGEQSQNWFESQFATPGKCYIP